MRRIKRALGLILWFAAIAGAHPLPVRITDFNPKPAAGGAMSDLYAVSGQLFFYGSDLTHGLELWRSDGTTAGTRLVKDVEAGVAGSGTRMLGQTNGILLFAIDAGSQRGLWRSDGTEAGTFRLAEVDAKSPRSLGSLMWFDGTTAGKDPDESEPWRTDGTVEGTFSISSPVAEEGARRPRTGVIDLPPVWQGPTVADRHGFAVITGGGHYFINGSRDLWKSGGTAATTLKVGSLPEVSGPLVRIYTAGSWLSLISFSDQEGLVWWASDGQPGVPRRLLKGESWSSFLPIGRFGNTTFVTVSGSFGRQFWKSDGTPAGTVKIADAPPDWLTSPTGYFAAEGMIFFSVSTHQHGREPWVLDVATGRLKLLKDIGEKGVASSPGPFQKVGSTTFFAASSKAGTRIWATKGESKGTREAGGLLPKGWHVSDKVLSHLGDTLYFIASHPVEGSALWRKDAAAKKAIRIATTETGTGEGISVKSTFQVADDKIYFIADDGINRLAWCSDGTAAGTFPLEPARKKKAVSAASSHPVPIGGRVVLSGPDPQNAGYSSLLVANGAKSVATRIPGLPKEPYPRSPEGMVQSAGRLYFHSRYDGKVWTTDGTAAGTVPLAPASGSPQLGWFGLPLLPDGAGSVFFRVDNSLWKGDAGTGTLRQIEPAGDWRIAVHAEALYFIKRSATGIMLWRNDGLGDASSGVFDFADASDFVSMTSAAGLLWVVVAMGDVDSRSYELWRSDGTGAGTSRVATFLGRDTVVQMIPGRLEGDSALFFVRTTAGNALWASDGSSAGTSVVMANAPAWQPNTLAAVVGPWVYFSGNDGIHGDELWRTDGTLAATTMVTDLTGDSGSSAPAQLTLAGSRLFFSATTAAMGRELYTLDVSADLDIATATARSLVMLDGGTGSADEGILKEAFRMRADESLRVLQPGIGRSGLPHFSTAISGDSRVFRVEYLRHKSGRWSYRPMCSPTLTVGSYLDMDGAEIVTDLDAEWERVVIEQPVDLHRTPRLFGVVEVTERP